MNLVLVAAVIAVCGAAKLDRTYLPPLSSQNAGGPPGSLQTPFITSSTNQGSQQTTLGRTSDSNPSQGNQLPPGSYENEYQGVVIEAAAAGTRASNQPTGLGGPRINYGSTDSKVGEAAFRGTKDQTIPATQNGGYQSQAQFRPFQSQGLVTMKGQGYPDLSGFYKPTGQINTDYKPGNQKFTDQASNIIKSHMNIGLNKFNYGFETENGIKKEENGVSDDGVKMQGGYSYTGDDGKVYSVTYTADKDGYRPMGSHLPTSPPIPVEILESLEKNSRDEANGIKDDGSYDAEKYNKEDDYAQSDTNGNDNDRQSNKFGERPGFNSGAGAVIHQDQQGFVRPNVQGQFNSYESSMQSFGTGVSGQSNKMEQPESNAGQSTFFNQDQQGLARPNIQGQSSSYHFSKDSSSAKPDSTKFGTGTSNNENTLAQIGQNTQFGNRFGAQSQYLPPRPPGNFLNSNSFQQMHSSKVGLHNNFKPQPGQNFQDQGPFGEPVPTLTTPNSYGTPSGQGSLNNNLFPSTQGSNSFGINTNNNYNRPHNDGAFFQTNIQSSPIVSSFSSGPLANSDISQENINNNHKSQSSFSQSSFQSSDDIKNENTNPDSTSNRFSSTFSLQSIPTKQPDLILTTPLENQEQQDNSGYSLLATSSIDSQPQKPYSINPGNSQTISSSSDRLSDSQFSSNLSGQTQGPDNSYIYSIPTKPFNTAPGTSFGTVNSIRQPFGSLFPNAPEGSVFSIEYQGSSGSNKYPQPPTFAPVPPTSPTPDQTNGITQASASPFPSISPTSSSQINSGEVYEYTKPAQELPVSSQEENAGESNFEINQQSSVPSSQNDDTTKPQVSSSNTQFGQRFPTTSTSAFGQPTIPLQFGTQTSSTFGQKPTQSQSGEQGTLLFGQIPTLSSFSAQTGSSFGQKPSQQQFNPQTFGQQTTPSRFNAQTSSPFGQNQSFSPFVGQTSTPLNQQTIPIDNSAQTSSSFGQKPTQPETSFSLGQQSTPSRFGVQTSSSFVQPTLSPFGSQTSFVVGQTLTQPQTSFSFGQNPKPQPQAGAQSGTSFGSQTTSSRFGVPTDSSFEQKPTLSIKPSCCKQISASLGHQTLPSRFGMQTGSIFDQKPTQAQLGEKTSFSFGSQATLSSFGVQMSSPFGQQTTPSKFGISSISSSGQQTTPLTFDKQVGSIFAQKLTTPQFDDSSSEQKPTTENRVDIKQQQSQSQKSNESSDQQSYSKPSKLQSSTSNSQNSQESVENTSTDEVYQYNKPTTSFSSNMQPQDSAQFGQQPSTQPDEQSFSSTSQNKDSSKINQQSQIALFPRFPVQSTVTDSQFGVAQPTNFQFVAPGSLSGQSFVITESTSDFPLINKDNTEKQPSTSFLNLQTQEQSQSTESGEVHHYNKPTSLPVASQNENTQFGQNTQQGQTTGQSGQNKLDATKPITSHLSQSNDKSDNDQLPTQNGDLSQIDSKPQKPSPSSSSLGVLPSSHPFPHLSFYSACCRGSKPQNQGSQPFSGKVPSSPLVGNLGGNRFGFNKNVSNQDTNNNGLIENKFGNQGFAVQKDTPSTPGKGEEFGGPRQPPKFDETGYHY